MATKRRRTRTIGKPTAAHRETYEDAMDGYKYHAEKAMEMFVKREPGEMLRNAIQALHHASRAQGECLSITGSHECGAVREAVKSASGMIVTAAGQMGCKGR